MTGDNDSTNVRWEDEKRNNIAANSMKCHKILGNLNQKEDQTKLIGFFLLCGLLG